MDASTVMPLASPTAKRRVTTSPGSKLRAAIQTERSHATSWSVPANSTQLPPTSDAGPCPRTWCKKDCLTRPPVARGAPGVAQRAAGGFQGGHR
jgi:hypothetical protein